jgi:predicted PurR-regulated permease PerM
MALTVAPAKALYVALAYLAIQQLEGNLITPLLMRNRIAVPPVLTIAAVSMMGIVFGVLGMLVSEPVAALAILVTRELHVRPLENGSHGPEDDEPDEHQRDHAQEEPGQPAGELGAKALRNHR